jgi:hypothetical protein
MAGADGLRLPVADAASVIFWAKATTKYVMVSLLYCVSETARLSYSLPIKPSTSSFKPPSHTKEWESTVLLDEAWEGLNQGLYRQAEDHRQHSGLRLQDIAFGEEESSLWIGGQVDCRLRKGLTGGRGLEAEKETMPAIEVCTASSLQLPLPAHCCYWPSPRSAAREAVKLTLGWPWVLQPLLAKFPSQALGSPRTLSSRCADLHSPYR